MALNSVVSRPPNADWPWPDTLDALIAAPAHHRLLLENDHMRVVETCIAPGQIVPVHTHRLSGVLFIRSWSDLVRRDPDGNVLLDTRQLTDKPALNEPLWQPPLPPHSVENAGMAEFIGVQVEIKQIEITQMQIKEDQ